MELLEYTAVRILAFIFRALPEKISRKLGIMIALSAKAALPKRRGIVKDNLKKTFPGKSENEINRIALETWKHSGIIASEFARSVSMTNENVFEKFEFVNEENYIDAISMGRGVIMLASHIGNWELMGMALAVRGYKLLVIARQLRNRPGSEYIKYLRERAGMKIVYEHEGVKETTKYINEGGSVAIIIDQHITEGGVIVDFLGRPAYTTSLIPLLAKKTGAPVIPFYNLRQPSGRYTVYFEKAIELYESGNFKQDIIRNTAMLNGVIGKWIKKTPEQWFWLHNRWKVDTQENSTEV